MKSLLTATMLIVVCSYSLYGQYLYEPSPEHPYGLPHPDAPEQIKDYQPMIGKCDCTSLRRDQEGKWLEPESMTWEFKYILNGMGVQDQTLKEDGGHSGSIRQYLTDSSQWYVHYYSTTFPTTTLSTWSGGKVYNNIILYKDQTAPNGMEGKYKITFSEISELGFNWLGEWVNLDESFKYPTWKIKCIKRKE